MCEGTASAVTTLCGMSSTASLATAAPSLRSRKSRASCRRVPLTMATCTSRPFWPRPLPPSRHLGPARPLGASRGMGFLHYQGPLPLHLGLVALAYSPLGSNAAVPPPCPSLIPVSPSPSASRQPSMRKTRGRSSNAPPTPTLSPPGAASSLRLASLSVAFPLFLPFSLLLFSLAPFVPPVGLLACPGFSVQVTCSLFSEGFWEGGRVARQHSVKVVAFSGPFLTSRIATACTLTFNKWFVIRRALTSCTGYWVLRFVFVVISAGLPQNVQGTMLHV